MTRVWPAVPDSVPEIGQWVYDTARSASFSEREAQQWVLAVEEVTVNIVHYAYGDGPVGTIEIETVPSADGLTVHLSDNGRSFNPLAAPDPQYQGHPGGKGNRGTGYLPGAQNGGPDSLRAAR